ncbi:MAG TPA: SprB repeat-containing protein, partial [Chitinophagales bacterium]|nr:SprB repeat-containing protein [Chitinophagales bacterium]
MKNVLRAAALVILLAGFSSTFAQFPGCPAVSTATQVTIPCGQTCTTLTANAFSAAATTSYNVGAISYAPPFTFTQGTPILVATDDLWSGVINLPFNFCFFGNTYNKIIVGSNGVIGFNTANAGATNNWQIPGPIPSTAHADLENCIMGPWQDLDPTYQGALHYDIQGTAPCRTFEVSWNNVPMYGDPNSFTTGYCTTAYSQSQQIVIYETTNAIDVYIKNKQYCTGWNNGYAVEGIQNATGTVAYTVTGRNATTWNATNDAYRFTPSGAPNYTITWFQGNTQIGTGSNIQVCPTTGTLYTATATYTNCDNSTVQVSSAVYVGLAGLNIQIDSVHQVSCNNGNDGALVASINGSSGVISYGWTPGTPGDTAIYNLTPGTYIFSVSDSAGCTKSDTVVLANPTAVSVSVPNDTVTSCTGTTNNGTLTANGSGGTPGYGYVWNTTATTQTITGLSVGSYNVTATDTHGCTATGSGSVSVSSSALSLGAPQITNVSCNGGTNGQIIVSLTGGSSPITYSWSGGTVNGDTVSGLGAGTYTVTATDGNGCSATGSYTVTAPSAVTFGQPTITNATCGSNTGSITASASGGTGTITYTWSNTST